MFYFKTFHTINFTLYIVEFIKIMESYIYHPCKQSCSGSSPCPLSGHFLPLLPVTDITVLFYVLIVLSFLEGYIHGTGQCVTLRAWLLSRSCMYIGFFHNVMWISSSLFNTDQCFLVWMHHCLSIHSPMDGHRD